MRINKLTGTAFAASVASAAGTGACTSEVELVSPNDPLGTLVKCAAKLSVSDGTTNEEYIALYRGCVTALANKAGSDFPALVSGVDSDCRSCYSTFAEDIAAALVGSVAADDAFVAGTTVSVCTTMATSSEKDECLKSDGVIEAMIAFQSCAGQSINYPAGASLARQRALFRADAFKNLTQNAFGSSAEIGDILEDVITHNDSVGATMQTGGELHLDLCLIMYHTELDTYANALPDTEIVDACAEILEDTTDCVDSAPVVSALENFMSCSGYDMQVLETACTAEETDAIWQADGYASIVNCVFNDDIDDPATECEDDRLVLNDALIADAGEQCGACYVELGVDLQTSFDDESNYGTNCVNPYSADCKIRSGLAAVTSFKECSGQDLDRSAPVATTEAPEVTTAAPAEDTTAAPVITTTAAPITTKSSSMTAPLVTVVVLAIGSLVL